MGQCSTVSAVPPDAAAADLLVIGCFEGEPPAPWAWSSPVARAVELLARRPGFVGGEHQYVETSVAEGAVGAVACKGLGKAAELDASRLAGWLYQVAEAAQHNHLRRLAVALPTHAETRGPVALARVARALALSSYRFDRYLTDRRDAGEPLAEIFLVVSDPERAAVEEVLPVVRAVAAGIALARDLANTPANIADPRWMEEQARQLAEGSGLGITVLQRADLEARGMGGLLAVGAGSPVPPRLLRLVVGEGPHTIALVGKGITFDTGGISLKPAPDMDEMKYDKSGACTVLGVARAVAELELPVRLDIHIPLAENMPDGSSYRPGDIIRCFNGTTVEIKNTDAEGRLILADAMAFAAQDRPRALLELSTLTGAAVVALGNQAAALYCPDDGLAAELAGAGQRSGERLWRMPLWPQYTEAMRGQHADLKNTAGRWGGANLAAAFLSRFVGDLARWAHLDIAGVAYVGQDGDEPRGATGFGVASTVEWLRQLAVAP
jgi:leucyl aminopeptidase